MKVIQSYIPYQEPYKFILDRDYLYIMMLSSLMAKKKYGGITLYTNKTQKKHLKNMGFEYLYDTKVLNDVKEHLWVIPKLLSCLQQKSSFIHIDLDTILLDKLDIDSFKSPFVFAHPDISDEDIIRDGKTQSLFKDWNLWNFFKAYLDTYYSFDLDIEQPNDSIPTELCSIPQIPNMSVIVIKDKIKEFHTALNSTLDLYHFKKDRFDNIPYSAMFLEQLCLPLYLKQETGNVNFDFLCTTKEIRSQTSDSINLKNIQYFHVNGGRRNNKEIISSVIFKIIDEFGEEYIENIFNYFVENKKVKTLTEGEKLYEKYNNNPIFTKKYMNII